MVERELTAAGATALSVRTDVSRRSDVEALAQRTLDAFGAVHLLVNNAGVGAGSTPWESTWEDWEWVMGVNLWGVIHGVKVFTPIMLAQNEEAHIVNTASNAGLVSHHPVASYQVTKHAVVALSENLYFALAARHASVKVSVLCPGWVKTQILDAGRNRPPELRREPAELSHEQQAIYQSMLASLAAGISPREVADHVFAAIREERFYTLTHPQVKPLIQERLENILQERNPRISP